MASCCSLTSGSSGFVRAWLNSRMSAPPENAFAEPMITTALTAASASARLRPSIRPARSALPRPFTGGLFMVMTATPSRTAYCATSLMRKRLLRVLGRGSQAEPREQRAVTDRFGVSSGEQLLAVEHRVRPGEETERLHRVRHAFAPGGKPDPRLGHRDARRGDRAHELQGVQGLGIFQRSSRYAHQIVDRHAFGIRVEARELRDERRAVAARFAHADDAAAAHADSRGAHALERLEPVAVGARADDLAVELGRGVEVVVVVIEPGIAQALGLAGLQHAEGD